MQKDLVIYEMNVRAFTMDESSELDNNIRGSYLGVIEKVTSVLSLGITVQYGVSMVSGCRPPPILGNIAVYLLVITICLILAIYCIALLKLFLLLASKIPHLLELGINAVELLPIFEFDEMELQRRPNPRDHMVN